MAPFFDEDSRVYTRGLNLNQMGQRGKSSRIPSTQRPPNTHLEERYGLPCGTLMPFDLVE